jgi:exportin-2 (importin alpha re-exporter)
MLTETARMLENTYLLLIFSVNLYSRQTLAAYTKQIFTLLFHRLTSSKTTKYVKSLLVFFGVFICKYGAVNFIQLIDSIQPKMFGMVLDRLFIAETQKVTGAKEKKFVAVGITKLLCEAPATISGEYSTYWFVNSCVLFPYF